MTRTFDFAALLPYWEICLHGCLLTLALTALSTVHESGPPAFRRNGKRGREGA